MLTVANAPRYAGTLSVSNGSSSTPGNLQPAGSGTILQNGFNPQIAVGGGSVPAVAGTVSVAPPPIVNIGPSVAQIAEANRMRSGRNLAGIRRQGLESGARMGITDNTNTYSNDNTGFVSGVKTGQETINTNRTNNALNLRRTMSSIAGGVRQGLKSGGVDLANMNALDSGASEAMARAWARAGNLQAGGANNQAELATNELNTAQTNLDEQEKQGLSKLRTWRTTETARVSNKLFQDLQVLEAESAANGYGGVVDMGVKDRLIAQATAEMDNIDRNTNDALGSIRGLTQDEINKRAIEMEQAGTQVMNPFAVEGPTGQFSNNPSMEGPAVGQITTGPRTRDDQLGLV